MPVLELERSHSSTPINFARDFISVSLDDINQPNPGGRFEPILNPLMVPLASDRILPTVEPQKVEKLAQCQSIFPATGSISFNSDFERINILHAEFGIRERQRLSHDPIMDRARFERAKTDEERQAVRQGVIDNMEKTLYERAYTSQSAVVYHQDDEGKIYNPNFPGESFDVVLQRGVEYSKSQGFVDYQREVAELEGWKKIMVTLFDPKIPLESKAVNISGPGFKKGTAFTDNFVDIFTKTLDPVTNKVVVVMTRFASEMNYAEYSKVAVCLDSNYFDSGEMQIDEEDIYFKERPIFIDSRIDLRNAQQFFNEEFKKQKRATGESQTRSYLAQCRLFVLHYAETICSEFFEPEKIKIAFNAVVNKFDSLRKGATEVGRIIFRKAVSTVNSIKEEIEQWGRRPVEAMMVGCGLSEGFSVGGSSSLISNIISAVGKIVSGIFSKDKDYCIKCGACGAEIKCVVRRGQKCPKCPAIRRC